MGDIPPIRSARLQNGARMGAVLQIGREMFGGDAVWSWAQAFEKAYVNIR
jgi:hypothetical protein